MLLSAKMAVKSRLPCAVVVALKKNVFVATALLRKVVAEGDSYDDAFPRHGCDRS